MQDPPPRSTVRWTIIYAPASRFQQSKKCSVIPSESIEPNSMQHLLGSIRHRQQVQLQHCIVLYDTYHLLGVGSSQQNIIGVIPGCRIAGIFDGHNVSPRDRSGVR